MSEWLIPNNPKEYDIQDGLEEYGDEIEWTKTLVTKNIAVGDTVYLYVTAPVKSLTMKFVVVKSDVTIPTQKHSISGRETAKNWFKIKHLENVSPIPYKTLLGNGIVNGYIQSARLLKPNQIAALDALLEN